MARVHSPGVTSCFVSVIARTHVVATTELLDRELQLRALSDHCSLAAHGHGRVVLIAGEAGAGKTALINAFVRDARREARVLVGACDALATPRPLGPLLDIAPRLSALARRLLENGAPRHELFGPCSPILARAAPPTSSCS